MNFAVVREHREFFRKNHHIECEGIFTREEVDKIAQGVSAALAVRLKVPPKTRTKVTPTDEFAVGHDLWRTEHAIKKVLLHRNLAEIASELTEHKPLRFGYDMLLPSVLGPMGVGSAYRAFLEKNATLNEISGIQGIVCGGMLCVSAPGDNSQVASNLFPKIPGHVVFFSPEWQLPLQDKLLMEGYCHIMFVYVNAKAVYCRRETDPHLHDFRDLGYQFGDKLTDGLNPIVF